MTGPEAAPEICSACYYGVHEFCMWTDHPDIAKCQCNRYSCAMRRAAARRRET